jgi:putative ABC transport system permease protein
MAEIQDRPFKLFFNFSLPSMEGLLRDTGYALRQLRKSPAFAVTTILMLGLAIGATTAVFSIVEGILLRPLPFRDPGRLVILSDHIRGIAVEEPGVTAPDIRDYMRDTNLFASLGGYRTIQYELSGAGEPAVINTTRLTSNVFPLLGIEPMMGRVFTRGEEEQGQAVAVLSYSMWRNRFHADHNVLGKKLLLDRKPYLIIGVMPRSFEFPLSPGHLSQSELWVPMSLTPAEITDGAGAWFYRMIGRLKPGLTVAQTQSDAERVAQEIMHNYPARLARLRIDAIVRPLQEDTVEQARSLLNRLFLAVSLVLLIACANLAGLLLVRSIRRRRQVALRLALGASSQTLVRQAVLESLALSVSGGLLGVGFAAASFRLVVRWLPDTLPRMDAIDLDWVVIGFALLLALATGLLCGIAPAFAALRTNMNEALKAGGYTGSADGGHARLRALLVVAQIAVALVLLTASGLLLRSFQKMRDVDLGYQPQQALMASYSLPNKGYASQAQVDTFNRELLRRLEHLPGAQSAALTSLLPTNEVRGGTVITPQGYVAPSGGSVNMAMLFQLKGNYLQTMGIPLLRGRSFTDGDDATAQLVVIVNRKLAEHYWPNESPIGKHMKEGTAERPNPWLTVIGEIPNVTLGAPDAAVQEQYFLPVAQVNASLGERNATDIVGKDMYVVLRTSLSPETMESSLRAVFHSLDRQLAVDHVQSMDQAVSTTEAPRLFNTAVIAAFGTAAVVLAIVGIYGVIAFSVALRTQELSIRMALGASRPGILRLILGSGLRLAGFGCAGGLLAAILVARLLRSLLFEVSWFDPLVLICCSVGIVSLALVASAVPAMRATQIDPMTALRTE